MKFIKSQASFEYMLVAGIMFIGVTGAVFFLFGYLKTAESEVSEGKLSYIAELINKYTTEAYYTTGIYKKEIQVQIPLDVLKIYTYNNSHNTYSFMVFETYKQNYTYALNTLVCANVIEITSGRIIIEKGFVDNYVNFCTYLDNNGKCNCSFS
jgi:hypothetical protein